MMFLEKAAAAATLLVLGGLLGGCSKTNGTAVSYGERTGVNIGVFVDPTKSLPIESNFGLVRRVVSHVPALDCDAVAQEEKRAQCLNGQDSVDVVSAFHMKRTARDDRAAANALNGKLTISTAFITGQAAVDATENSNAKNLVAKVSGAVDADQATPNRTEPDATAADTTEGGGDPQPLQEAGE
ncbi:hypothetical protein [Sulfitobacter sp. AS59]|uniref:hypothetical protein n=1 Tax=Sulfitobacter sp. AS59 TaxID=3135784 RepID=UPI00317857F8